MPFVVRSAPPVVVQPPRVAVVPRREPDPGRPIATWIAPDGTVVPLTSDLEAHFTLDAVGGWGAAPITLVADADPRGGSRVRHIQPQPRSIDWPIRVVARTHIDLVQRWRALVRAFTMTRRLGPGRLQITRPDGTTREIEAYFDGGMAGTPGQGHTDETAVISLYCPDPYWRATTPAPPIERAFSSGSASFFAPFLSVASSQVLGDTTLYNEGEVEARPQWEITGPATQLMAANLTTGESFRLVYNLAAGQTITITTEPPTVRGPNGEVLTSALDWPANATLWRLEPEANGVVFEVSGGGPGTKVVLSYVPRFETA